jgi:DNA-directed RNA polymerase subunit F
MSKSYKVGYGRPPRETQFKPGESGNPKGRRKGSKNLSTQIAEALAETVTIKVDGRSRRVSKLQASFMQQANKAATGDARATKLMVELLMTANLRDAATVEVDSISPERRRELDAMLIAAIKPFFQGGDDEN